ncbi:putative mitochondrial transcription termination factor family protein isoform X1 [Iris pallida]|uniref:Mitochondrial transcription termination factor family protein isoform X1 n=1 Tax=Iris pallida TaxID=29817 RepID=A0AAX6EAZ1_IRIPA|nr:putative mitochondrial transcription termination factor family protein isoform X1 [Iris pallida]
MMLLLLEKKLHHLFHLHSSSSSSRNSLLLLLRFSTTLQTLQNPSSSSSSSPPKSAHFMVEEYLINKCGLSPDKALKASKDLTHLKSPSNPDSVLLFLRRRCGLSDPDIAALVSRRPDFLCFNVEKTLKPKLESLQQDLGFTPPELVRLLSQNPNALCYLDLGPKLDFLKTLLGGSNENLLKALEKDLFLLGANLHKTLLPNVSFLRHCGVSDTRITKLMTQKRGFVTKNPAEVEAVVAWTEELGAPRGSTMFYHMLQTLVCFTRATFEAKRQLWTGLGMSGAEFMAAFRRHPALIHLSEGNARRKVEFLLKEAGFEMPYLARRPGMFTYSLERRVRPRSFVLRLLKREGLPRGELDVFNAMSIVEERFIDKFVSPNEEKVPDLREAYLAACAVMDHGMPIVSKQNMLMMNV